MKIIGLSSIYKLFSSVKSLLCFSPKDTERDRESERDWMCAWIETVAVTILAVAVVKQIPPVKGESSAGGKLKSVEPFQRIFNKPFLFHFFVFFKALNPRDYSANRFHILCRLMWNTDIFYLIVDLLLIFP